MPSVIAFGKKSPEIHRSVFLADGARIIGDVVMGENSSVWFNAVVRGDVNTVRIGCRVNIQDNATLHVTHGTGPLTIGDDSTVGHGATVHACTIESMCLVGMGATVLDRAVIGRGSIVAAGSLVLEGTHVPEGVLVAGVPAVVKRRLTGDEHQNLKNMADRYVEYAHHYLMTLQER